MLPFKPKAEDIDPNALITRRGWVDAELVRLGAGSTSQASSFALIANWHWASAIIKAKNSAKLGLVGFNWPEWRQGLEYADLMLRACPPRRLNPTSIDMTFILEVAFSRILTGHPKAAERVLKGTNRLIVSVVNDINDPPSKPIILPGDMGIIGLLYERVLGEKPQHPAFQRVVDYVTKVDLAALPEKRKRYAKKGREQGALLAGYSYELIPLEALFVNSLLPEAEKDASLTLMAEAIAATEYPDDPVLEGYDARLSALGL